MKKIISSILSTTMILSLCGCSASNNMDNKKNMVTDITTESEIITETEITTEAGITTEAEIITEIQPLPYSKDDINYDYSDAAIDYLNYIGNNLTDRSYSTSGSDHDATVEFIISELIKAGYSEDQITSIVTSTYPYVQNVILTVPGYNHNKQIIVGAHYDGDGVGDNGSGLSLLLATAVNLYGLTPTYDVIYIFFDSEEYGLCGAEDYANSMTQEEIDKTIYMVNIDSIAFGDYCCIYGGSTIANTGKVIRTEAYDIACKKALDLGMDVIGTEALDGFHAQNGTGPEITPNTFYTNPWTKNNPPPYTKNYYLAPVYSPSTLPASDHYPFDALGMSYIYFEATNWFAGEGLSWEFSGYYETYDTSLGENGMFMNTQYDTLDILNECFPNRAIEHFKLYSPLLTSIILDPLCENQI